MHLKDVAEWISNLCPSGDFVDCPAEGTDCEDNPPSCFENIELIGFGPEFDGNYTSHSHKQAIEFYENGKQLYILNVEDSGYNRKCLWWYKTSRNWILGDCENVGTYKGFAYIQPDVPCPHPEEELWVNPKTGKYFPNIKNFSKESLEPGKRPEKSEEETDHDEGAGFGLPLEKSGSAGLSAVVRTGYYEQKCHWQYWSPRWRCV